MRKPEIRAAGFCAFSARRGTKPGPKHTQEALLVSPALHLGRQARLTETAASLSCFPTADLRPAEVQWEEAFASS